MAESKPSKSEMPESEFRKTAEWRDLTLAKAEQRKRERAERRARWPLSRLLRVGLTYGGPVMALVGWYWMGKAFGLGLGLGTDGGV